MLQHRRYFLWKLRPLRFLWRNQPDHHPHPICEAISKALGNSLSEVLDLYFGELDEVQRGHLIGDAMNRRMLGEQDQEWLERESWRRDATEVAPYHKDNKF
jgi:hypothetical protein